MAVRPRRVARLALPAGLSALAVALGCASLAPSFPVHATPGQIESLSGDWRGEYVGDRDHGRHGSIAFTLVAGEDHAHGTILMIPAGAGRPYQPYRGDELTLSPPELARRRQILEIQFVNAADDTVSGVVASYWDPDRRTQASATFNGQLTDDTIVGTFTTTYANGAPATTGRWTVKRVR